MPVVSRGGSFLVRAVRVFDGARVVGADSVRVDDGVIVEVGTGLEPRPGVPVVDGTGGTLLPGLVDGHTHTPPDAGHAERALRQALAFGVTTVICLGTDPATAEAMKARAAESAGLADIRSAGRLVTVAGGHPTQLGDGGYSVLAGPGDVPGYIEEHVAAGMDQVKIVIEDGTTVARPIPCVPPELSDAVTAEAHRRGLLVIAHVATERDALQALSSGVDGLAHQYLDTPQSAAIAGRLQATGTFVCMTLAGCHNAEGVRYADDSRVAPYVEHHWLQHLARGFPSGWPPESYLRNALGAVAVLRQAQVRIVAGTDAPNPGTGHGVSVHHELACLVRGGLTPTEALTAATSAAAASFRLTDRGRIVPGLRADLILVAGDPIRDIDSTLDIRRIWRGGEPFNRTTHREGVAARAARVTS